MSWQKSTYREIEISSYLPTEQELVVSLFAAQLEQNEVLCSWVDRYQPLPMHLALKHYYAAAALPPEQRSDTNPLPPDPHWTPGAVQIFLLYGPTRCLAADTRIPYCLFAADGRKQNSKGGTIAHLYRRFHGLSRKGKGAYQRPQTIGSSFYTASVDEDGRIVRNRIVDVVYAGLKPCLEIALAGGSVLVATAEHKVLTPSGYVEAGDLTEGSFVMVRPSKRQKKKGVVGVRVERAYLYVKHHPVAGVKVVSPKSARTAYSYSYHRLLRSRAVMEARLNGLTLEAYIERLNSGCLEGLSFLPRSVAVHHRDEDFTNDAPENLMLLTQAEHSLHHLQVDDMRTQVVEDYIVSIRPAGMRETYDLCMAYPMNNYVANDIVVHNSGKTNSAIEKAVEDMCEVPGLTVLAVRRTYDEINDTIYGDAQAFCDKYAIPYKPRLDPPEMELPNGSSLVLRSTQRDEKPGQDKAASLQGMEFGAAILEEADRIPEHYFETVVTRLSQSGLPRPWILILCNPPSKNHWIYKRFFVPHPETRRIPDNYHALHYPLEHNRHNLRQGYIEDIQRELKDSPSRYQRFFEGLFCAPIIGKALFKKHFRYDTHVLPYRRQPSTLGIFSYDELSPIEGVDIWVGFDFGFVHPAVVACQEDVETGQVRVLWEYMGNEVLVQPFVEDVKRRLAHQFPGYETRWFVDPHGRARNSQTGRSDMQVLRDCGISPTSKDLSVSAGLSIMAQLLNTYLNELDPPRPLLVVADRCTDLIDGFQSGYVQDPKRHIDGTDDQLTPYKDGFYEHLMDALRYVLICTRHMSKSRKGRHVRRGRANTWEKLGGTYDEPDSKDAYGRMKLFGMEQYDDPIQAQGDRAPYYGFGEVND